MGQVFKSVDKVKKKGEILGRTYPIFCWENRGEKEREEERANLRSTEFHWLEFIEPRTKVHHLDKGYACVPKMKDFTEDPKEEIWRNQSFWAKEMFLRPLLVLLRSKR